MTHSRFSLLVLLLDESVFLNESLELIIQSQKNLTATFATKKKKKGCAQELIGGIYILILQQVSDSGIVIDFRLPTLPGLWHAIHCSPPTGLGMYNA